MVRRLAVRMAAWLNNINIRNKMFFSFTVVVFIPVMAAGLYLTIEFRQMALDNAVEQMEQNVERVTKRLEEALGVPIDLSGKLMVDHQLRDLVSTVYPSAMEATRQYRSYHEFGNLLRTYDEVAQFRLYVDNPTLLDNWQVVPLDERVAGTFWYREGWDQRGRIGWYYMEDPMKFMPSTLSMVRKLDFANTWTDGLLVIDLNTDYLNAFLRQESFETMVVDVNGTVVAAGSADLPARPLEETRFSGHLGGLSEGIHELDIDGASYMVVVKEFWPDISYNGLKVISIFAVETVLAEANKISTLGLTAMGLGLVVSFFLIYWVSLLLSNRLLRLNRQINKVASGNLDTRLEVDGADEIGVLSRQFNAMVRSVQELMEEVAETNRQKNAVQLKQNEIKLKMMASQINPHFLFNALESIRMKAHIGGQAEIAQTVKLLGKLMRKNIEIGGNDIPLESELDMVRTYLDIQKFRYEERLHYRIDAAPATLRMLLPPLVIQPLVENAVVHGIEGKEEGGTITVSAKLEEGMLAVAVRDDGAGVDADKLAELRRMLAMAADAEAEGDGASTGAGTGAWEPDRASESDLVNSDNRSIGLINVHERLRLTYGEPSGLQIDSVVEQGFLARFVIPLNRSF